MTSFDVALIQRIEKYNGILPNNIENDCHFFCNKKDENAYQVEVTWTYKENTGEGYQTKATLYFVHEDKKLYLVEMKK